MIVKEEPNIYKIPDNENPIYIWNIIDQNITKKHKIVLYNMMVLAGLGIEEWNTPKNLSQVCNMNEIEITMKLEDLTNLGYLQICSQKFWFSDKFFNELKKCVA